MLARSGLASLFAAVLKSGTSGSANSRNPEALGDEQRLEFRVVLFFRRGKQAVGIAMPMLHFLEGVDHAQCDDFRAVGTPAGEAVVKFLLAGGHDEEIDEGALDLRILATADLVRALDINIHHDVGACLEIGKDFGFERAVEIFVDDGVFEKFAGIELSLEVLVGEKVVVLAIDLAGTWLAGGAGNGVVDLAGFRQLAAQRGFSRA